VTTVLGKREATPQVPICVNGTEILRAAIAGEVQYHSAPSPSVSWRMAAEALVIRELLLQEARRQGLSPRPELDDKGRRETDDEALIRDLVEREVQVPDPAEEELRRIYGANQTPFRSREIVQARHILIAARATDEQAFSAARQNAEAITTELAACPELFEELARNHSDCASAGEGGVLGQLVPGETTPEFEAALAVLGDGEITREPVATRYGFHIIRLDRRISGEQLPFESVALKIADYLAERGRRTATAQYIARLISRAEISGIELAGADAHRVN
jgi:peptidyl-prolyl cis-trans isomerase C